MHSSSFCASSNGFLKDTCEGDSGGPLVVEVEGKKILIGITSYGSKGCDSPDFPGYFTKVSNFTDWINITMSQN